MSSPTSTPYEEQNPDLPEESPEEEEKTPTKEEVGYIAKKDRYTYAPNCSHQCSGNCRRVGCNCECGEFHGYYEQDEIQEETTSMEEKKEKLDEMLIDSHPLS